MSAGDDSWIRLRISELRARYLEVAHPQLIDLDSLRTDLHSFLEEALKVREPSRFSREKAIKLGAELRQVLARWSREKAGKNTFFSLGSGLSPLTESVTEETQVQTSKSPLKVDAETTEAGAISVGSYTLRNVRDTQILCAAELDSDVDFEDVYNSVIMIKKRIRLAAAYASSLEQCVLLFNDIATSLVVRHATLCLIICRKAAQVRVSSSQKCLILTLPETPPVIEDCNDLIFGDVGLDEATKISVVDFDWRHSSEPSPHFTTLSQYDLGKHRGNLAFLVDHDGDTSLLQLATAWWPDLLETLFSKV